MNAVLINPTIHSFPRLSIPYFNGTKMQRNVTPTCRASQNTAPRKATSRHEQHGIKSSVKIRCLLGAGPFKNLSLYLPLSFLRDTAIALTIKKVIRVTNS